MRKPFQSCIATVQIYLCKIYLPFEPKRTFGKINEKDEARNGSSAVKQQTKQENYRNRNKTQFVSTFICSLQSSQRKYLYFPNRANKKIAKTGSIKMFVKKNNLSIFSVRNICYKHTTK